MAEDRDSAQGGTAAAPGQVAESELAGGSYELIRERLVVQARGLGELSAALNTRRQEVFGGTQLAVVGNARVRTENNCRPRDIVQVSGHMLFGYNVFIGLRTETRIEDVLGLYDLSDAQDAFGLELLAADHADTAFLHAPEFVRDFEELYRYYKEARLVRLTRNEAHLLAVFQIGQSDSDLRIFRFQLSPEGVRYIDNRGDREYRFPPSHAFEWTQTTRDQQVAGRVPHANIEDELFVETSGGDLTLKVENNTETGKGIYNEPVEEDNQSLDDAEIHYARVGALILLKVLPYREERYRYLVFATRSHRVQRIDAIGEACLELPEDHGIIFPGGYFLQDGQYKVFDGDFSGFQYERRVLAPNGEDVLYVFHRHLDGHYVLFPYNLIRKEVQTPIHCHGYSLFEDGRMVIFRSTSDEPTRVHAMQLWQTPFVSEEFAAQAPQGEGLLENIGNAELVRGISDCYSIRRAVEETEPSRQVYEDLIAAIGRTLDAYYWLEEAEVGNLRAALEELRSTTELIVDEFVKVTALKEQAQTALSDAERAQVDLLNRSRPDVFRSVQEFMGGLTGLRTQRGHLITLKEVRYIDAGRLDELEQQVVEAFDRLSRATAAFLLQGEALAPLRKEIEELLQGIEGTNKTHELAALGERLEETSEGLTVLSEVVGSLEVEDPVERTAILEHISEVFAQLNRVRATFQNRKKELLSVEGKAEFAAQFTLFSQSVTSAMGLADTPERCDEQLSRLMVQLEELEARFSEFDEFLADLTSKREEVYQALEQKKQQLLDERQRRAENLLSAADRILVGIERRAKGFAEADELNAYFASDPMVLKLQELAERLEDLGDAPRAEGLRARLKTERQNAARSLRDKLELFEEGQAVVKFGQHRFAVNQEALELTLLASGDDMQLALSGTNFREPVSDSDFEATRDYWDQHLVSETPDVYRGEYLAASILFDAQAHRDGLSLQGLRDAERTEEGLFELVRKQAAARFDEGYERGLHDADATRILEGLLHLHDGAGLLRFSPDARAVAVLFWALAPEGVADVPKEAWRRRARSLRQLREVFEHSSAVGELAGELGAAIGRFCQEQGLDVSAAQVREAGAYLVEELGAEEVRFASSAGAERLRTTLLDQLHSQGTRARFEQDLEALQERVAGGIGLARAWLEALSRRTNASLDANDAGASRHVLLEAAVQLFTLHRVAYVQSSARTVATVEGLLGQHPRIVGRKLELRLDEFLARLSEFIHTRVPGYRRYRELRHALLERERARLRLDEFMPRVLSSFVRNRLINEVYLPLIGDNLAKQLGAVGDSKRTDLMGLLLLISPPGYGKTTLMEYIASRLGLVFMKINGPSLGHGVTSLDPGQADSATARQEVEKVNLAFEMGNNVMLYLDDIQHTHPEFLQKFISLCDGQRRIEGVWKGNTRTYDLRGRRFCVVMAGNPYTESGEKFQIPDMLANRADTYNLGDILGGSQEAFALSYVENSITSNPVLSQLANRDQADVYRFVRLAQGEEVRTSELSHGYSSVEVDEIVAVLRRMFQVRDILLSINQTYIASASMDDRFRTEPPFKLQGSYRNMNKLAEKVVAAMNDAELQQLISDHYQGEAQTLTTGAEQNLLKLAELRGVLTEEQAARWAALKKGFQRVQSVGGGDDDPVTRVVGQLSGVGVQLEGIRDALSAASERALAARAEQERALVPEEPVETAAEDAAFAQHREMLTARLGQIVEAVEGLARRNVDVQVQADVGRDLLGLMEQHGQLVREGIMPLVQHTVRQAAQAARATQTAPQVSQPTSASPGAPVGAPGAAPVEHDLHWNIGHILGLTRAIAERIDDMQRGQRMILRDLSARRKRAAAARKAKE